MNTYIEIVRKISKVCGVISTALILSAIIVIMDMVIERYFLNLSTSWQTEYVIYSLAASTFIGCPYVLMVKGHVNVELLPQYFGYKGKLTLALLASFFSLLFFLVLFILGSEMWYKSYVGNYTTGTIWNEKLWKLYLSFPVGMFITILQYIADIASLLTKREMPFPDTVQIERGTE
jgi:TRAP-type C4-dicarboxylate transport system permease small subunit